MRGIGGHGLVGGDGLGNGLTLLARPGDQHFVVGEISAVCLVQQQVGAMYILGVDGRHHERGDPAIQDLVIHWLHTVGLVYAGKTRCQGKRVGQCGQRLWLFCCGGHGGLEAGQGAARPGALHTAHASPDSGQYGSKLFFCCLLQKVDAQIKRDGIEAAGEYDTCAAGFCRVRMSGNHLLHPGGFATQVYIVGASLGTGCDQFVAMQLVGANRGQHNMRIFYHGLQRCRITGVGQYQGQLIREAEFIAYGL